MPTEGGEQYDLLESESLSLTVARLRLKLAPEHPIPRVDHLRAAIASVKPELDLLHQHGQDGLIYRYPRVIYRVVEREPTVVAVAEGIEVLSALTLVGNDLRLGAFTRRVVEATLNISDHALGPSRSSYRYRFTAPWLALNQENHARFGRMDAENRRRLLDAQVANNCLSLAKSFGLRITTRLAGLAHVRPVPVPMKNVEMVGFFGEFEVNFNIPDGLGLGKSVSKGFGAVRRMD
jgi:CRISPR-associated endoribonuclease Cas6